MLKGETVQVLALGDICEFSHHRMHFAGIFLHRAALNNEVRGCGHTAAFFRNEARKLH